MKARFELLWQRVEHLRTLMRSFSLGYIKNPCVTVYNTMMSWFKEINISIYSSISGELYHPIVHIVDDIVLNFRKDLVELEGKISGGIYGFAPSETTMIT